MLNRNFANMVAAQAVNLSSSSAGVFSIVKKDGTEINDFYRLYMVIYNYLTSFSTLKINENQQNYFSTFSIGASDEKKTNAEEYVRYDLVSEHDLTDFSIDSATKNMDRSINAKDTFVQVWTYNGDTEKQIKEIGFFFATDGNTSATKFMIDRTVLDNPITVNNGDTFTIALTIGGKATAKVNS